MQVSPYLNFNGNCAEAFRFYERCLSGKLIAMQTFGESPMRDQVPPEAHGRVVHARLQLGEQVAGQQILMGSDGPPGHASTPSGFAVSIAVAAPDEGERIFAGLSEGGNVTMPYAKTFWSAGFGMVTDRFGIPWMVNCEQPA